MKNTPKFTTPFDSYVVAGEFITCEADGFQFTARIERDEDSHIDDDDTHNTVQSVTGCNDDQFADLLEARKAWKQDFWWYCGIVISASYKGVDLGDHLASLWGIEVNYPDSDNGHLLGIANELLEGEAIEAAQKALEGLRGKLA